MRGHLQLRVPANGTVPLLPFPGRYPTRFAVLAGIPNWENTRDADGRTNQTIVGTHSIGPVRLAAWHPDSDGADWPILYLGKPSSLRIASAIAWGYQEFQGACILEFQRSRDLIARYDVRRVETRRSDRRRDGVVVVPQLTINWVSESKNVYYPTYRGTTSRLNSMSIGDVLMAISSIINDRVSITGVTRPSRVTWRYYGAPLEGLSLTNYRQSLRAHGVLPRITEPER